MLYTVDKAVFDLNQDIICGILIGKNLKISHTTEDDEKRLRDAENKMRENFKVEQVRELSNVTRYRDIMRKANINPNKFPPSVEAMFKRILKGGKLPTINALVDLCNAVSIEQIISLGAHDLIDIRDDLEVRFSKEGDIFLPFGASEYEKVDEGEMVFASGNKVQTRKWIWRQSELGKTTVDSKDIFFQLVGFKGDEESTIYKAMDDIEKLIIERFEGECKKYIVDIDNNYIEF
jgi:DNA/RNA-binding domain of Phe-tRNA-synthetase-like protein